MDTTNLKYNMDTIATNLRYNVDKFLPIAQLLHKSFGNVPQMMKTLNAVRFYRDGLIGGNGYLVGDIKCIYCIKQNNMQHWMQYKNGNLIYNVCRPCFNYFVTTSLLSSYYTNYILLLKCKNDILSIINEVPLDVLKYIGYKILTMCDVSKNLNI